MKAILPWIKSNLVVVILVVVMVLALPTLLFLSARKNAKLRAQVQSQVDNDWRAIQSLSVRYSVPTLDPATPPLEFKRPPNAATTEALRERLEKLKTQSQEIVQLAVKHNRDGHVPQDRAYADDHPAEFPFQGLFPEPNPLQETKLRQEVADKWVAAHARLLELHGGGPPPAPDTVFNRLQVERSKLVQATGEPQTDEDRKSLTDRLIAMRLAMYRSRAAELRFYADPDVFVGVEPWKEASLPTLSMIWDWQHRFWIAQDLIGAVDLANTEPVTGSPLYVPDAPVKRVEQITIRPWRLDGAPQQAQGQDSFGGRGGGGGAAADPSAQIAPNYDASLTGRAGFPVAPNGLYDVRYAEMTMIVASAKIPRVLAAIAAQNFMAVTQLNIDAIDPAADLEQGYAYGPEHVVRLRLVIETAWLRDWTAPLMPAPVRAALGLPPAAGDQKSQPDGSRQGE